MLRLINSIKSTLTCFGCTEWQFIQVSTKAHNGNIPCTLLNARSAVSKLALLRADNVDPDITFVTEIWPSNINLHNCVSSQGEICFPIWP